MFKKKDINNVAQQAKGLTGQNQSSEGQRALIASYESVQDLLPETPAAVWKAWAEEGRRTQVDGRTLKTQQP